jgi:hypothetical protein
MKKIVSGTSVVITLMMLLPYISDNQAMAQSDTALFESHYVLPDFMEGYVKMKNGRIETAFMDYNKLTEEMIFAKNGTLLALDSLEIIDTVSIESRKFVPHQKVFYEVLVKGPVSLFVQHKCNLIPAGQPAGYGGTTETGASRNLTSLTTSGRAYKLKLPRDYHVTDAPQYWMRKNGIFYKANTAGQITKGFPEKSKEIKQYIKVNKLDLKDPKDLVTLIVKCNEFAR